MAAIAVNGTIIVYNSLFFLEVGTPNLSTSVPSCLEHNLPLLQVYWLPVITTCTRHAEIAWHLHSNLSCNAWCSHACAVVIVDLLLLIQPRWWVQRRTVDPSIGSLLYSTSRPWGWRFYRMDVEPDKQKHYQVKICQEYTSLYCVTPCFVLPANRSLVGILHRTDFVWLWKSYGTCRAVT
jgi:hypothetical protein